MSPSLTSALFLVASAAGEIDPPTLFFKANEAYRAGDYNESATLYGALVDSGYDSGEVYYNLGNSYLRQGKLGHAIAAYRHAQRQLPRHPDVRANLEIARGKTRDALRPTEPSPVLKTLFFWHYSLTLQEILYAVLLLNGIFWGGLGLIRHRSRMKSMRWIPAALATVLLLVSTSAALRFWAPNVLAVVTREEAPAHAGKLREGVVRFTLHAGAEVQVTATEGDWIRVALPSGTQGWMHQDDVSMLHL